MCLCDWGFDACSRCLCLCLCLYDKSRPRHRHTDTHAHTAQTQTQTQTRKRQAGRQTDTEAEGCEVLVCGSLPSVRVHSSLAHGFPSFPTPNPTYPVPVFSGARHPSLPWPPFAPRLSLTLNPKTFDPHTRQELSRACSAAHTPHGQVRRVGHGGRSLAPRP